MFDQVEGLGDAPANARGISQTSVLPEILEAIGGHFGVADRVHDVPVDQVMLEPPPNTFYLGEDFDQPQRVSPDDG